MQFARVPSTVSIKQSIGAVQGRSKNNFQGLQKGQGLQHYSFKRFLLGPGQCIKKYSPRKTSLQSLSLLWTVLRNVLISQYHVDICALYLSVTTFKKFSTTHHFPSHCSQPKFFATLCNVHLYFSNHNRNQPTHALFLGRVWLVRKPLRSLKLQVNHLRFSLAWRRMQAERATAPSKVESTISNQVTWHFGTSVFIAFGFFLERAQRNRTRKHGLDMCIAWKRSRVFRSFAHVLWSLRLWLLYLGLLSGSECYAKLKEWRHQPSSPPWLSCLSCLFSFPSSLSFSFSSEC